MRGSEVYDPDGASLTAVSFTERRYRIERGSNFSRGSLPIGGALSPESAFFNTLELPGYVREDFSAFSRPGLELAGKILKAPDTVSPLFRAYLFLGVGRLMSSRPEKWLVDYCQFGEDLETIRSIAGAAMTGADWCSSEKNAAVAAKLATFFSERKDPDYLDRAKAVYGFHARLFTGGIAFSGHLDHEGRVETPRPVDVAVTLWGPDPAPKSGEGKGSGSGAGPTQPRAADPEGAGEPDSDPAGEAVGGLRVEGTRLGVILDTSDSMTRYLSDLRTEIRSRFQNPRFLEVDGCLLEPSSQARGELPRGAPAGSSERESVMDAIHELVKAHGVDSIYWFSDLEDERTGAALRELAILLAPSAARPDGVRLYVRSTGREVDSTLGAVIKQSGGSFEVLR